MTNPENAAKQAEIDSVLDAALDALGDDDESEDEREAVIRRRKEKETKKGTNADGKDTANDVTCNASRRTQGSLSASNSPQQQASASNAAVRPEPPPPNPSSSVSTTSKNPSTTATNRTDSSTQQQRPVFGPPRPPPPQPNAASSSGSDEDAAEQMLSGFMEEMMKLEENPERLLSMLQQMESELQQQTANATATPKSKNKNGSSTDACAKNTADKTTTKSQKSQPKPTKKTSTNVEVEEAITGLLEGMSSSQQQQHRDDDVDNNDEAAMLQQLLEGFQSMGAPPAGEDDNANINPEALMDGMMEQLMAKELMYEPMKQVAQKFPTWLEQNQERLSEREQNERRKQCELFQSIVQTYDTEPSNTKKLVSLMQQVQEFGQPPAEIIHEIAPGLELDEDGVPKINFLDPNLKEECTIL